MTDVFITIPKPLVKERSKITATCYCRDGDSSDTPTTADYRIDCLTTGTTIQDWASLTPAASISISITPTHNRIVNSGNKREKKQLTVSADRGTSSETRDTIIWKVENIRGFDG